MIYKNNLKTEAEGGQNRRLPHVREEELQWAGGDEGRFVEREAMRLGCGARRAVGKRRGVVADRKGGSGEKMAEDGRCGVAETGMLVNGARANASKCEDRRRRSGRTKAGRQFVDSTGRLTGQKNGAG